MKISTQQLEQILIDVKGHTFCELEYNKIEKVKKKGNMNFIDLPVIKDTSINVGFNGSYENSVNNRLDKKSIDTPFKSEPLPWGIWKLFPKLIEHNSNVYVRFFVYKNSHPKSVYSYNNKIVEGEQLEELKKFLTLPTESAKKKEAVLDFEEQSKPLTINITNIKSITINKIKYEL